MKTFLVCRCGYRNHRDGKRCIACEDRLTPINQQPPPPRDGESTEDYAKRCGPVVITED